VLWRASPSGQAIAARSKKACWGGIVRIEGASQEGSIGTLRLISPSQFSISDNYSNRIQVVESVNTNEEEADVGEDGLSSSPVRVTLEEVGEWFTER